MFLQVQAEDPCPADRPRQRELDCPAPGPSWAGVPRRDRNQRPDKQVMEWAYHLSHQGSTFDL